MAVQVQKDWEALYIASIGRNYNLETIKARFSRMTQNQIDEFAILCAEYARKFREEGPGSVGQDLDLGLKLMEVCLKTETHFLNI